MNYYEIYSIQDIYTDSVMYVIADTEHEAGKMYVEKRYNDSSIEFVVSTYKYISLLRNNVLNSYIMDINKSNTDCLDLIQVYINEITEERYVEHILD